MQTITATQAVMTLIQTLPPPGTEDYLFVAHATP